MGIEDGSRTSEPSSEEKVEKLKRQLGKIDHLTSFYDIVRKTNPVDVKRPRIRGRGDFSTYDVQQTIRRYVRRCRKESDFAALQLMLRNELAEITKTMKEVARIEQATFSSPYLNTRELAQFLGVKHQTVQSWRVKKTGPPFHRVNAVNTHYRVEDVREWLKGRIKLRGNWVLPPDTEREHGVEASEEPHEFLSRTEAAKVIGVDPATLMRWVKLGLGPKPIRLHRRLLAFNRADLEACKADPPKIPKGRRPLSLSDNEVEAITRFLEHGSISKLAKELGCSHTSAQNRIVRYTLQNRK